MEERKKQRLKSKNLKKRKTERRKERKEITKGREKQMEFNRPSPNRRKKN